MQATEIPSILVQTKTAQALPAPPWRQVPAYYDEGSIHWMEVIPTDLPISSVEIMSKPESKKDDVFKKLLLLASNSVHLLST
ncbi:hypothetical protein TNCT_24071 [Trichonephila clavata]|uniref:Uncharacterized protein n=1 Tax=Trichonephila clavata TaxID=2740835 RepID=A0A8X6J2P6_TRICU|nr:hypothetical protein TNCT_24071 [Trichonephila clavata]